MSSQLHPRAALQIFRITPSCNGFITIVKQRTPFTSLTYRAKDSSPTLRGMMSNPEQPVAKMWSGRFREPLNKQFEEWQRSFPFDYRLLPHEVEASIGHARAIEAAGILTSEELLQMEHGLRAVAKLEDISTNEQAEDIHHFVELELTKLVGPLALKLHTGRSRNEQIATDMRL